MNHIKDIEKGVKLHPEFDAPKATFDVFLNEWTHVCRANFGKGRPCRFSRTGKVTTRWTGDSYKYDIFKAKDFKLHPLWAIHWWNGSGEGWLVTDRRYGRDQHNLLETISKMKSEVRRWDACHFIYDMWSRTTKAAAQAEAKKFRQAFVDGRLKKKKVRGQASYTVRIEPVVIKKTDTPVGVEP